MNENKDKLSLMDGEQFPVCWIKKIKILRRDLLQGVKKCRCKVCVTKLCKNAQLSWFRCKALCVMISTDY